MMAVSEKTLMTIVITVYNRFQFLAEAIESALGQTHPAIEVIVVDDGSTTDPQPAVAPFGDRVKLVRKQNGGLASSRNSGWAVAAGEYALFLDDDDYLEPRAIEHLVVALQKYPEARWAVGMYKIVDEHRNPLPS